MEAVKLDCYSLDVASSLSRLTGSEGFSVVRVSPEPRELPSESICSFIGGERAELVPNSWNRYTDTEFFCEEKRLPFAPIDDSTKDVACSYGEAKFCSPRAEYVKLSRKGGKGAKNSNSRRPSIIQSEDNTFFDEVDGTKGFSENFGSFSKKCDSNDKSQLVKRKSCFLSKRSDKRNSKLFMKNKFDCFSGKSGLVSCSSAAGGSNILGLYGLKAEIKDLTKFVDEIPLNDLLDGTYVGKAKEKKEERKSVDVVLAVKRAFEVCRAPKPIRYENITDSDCSNDKLPAGDASSAPFSSIDQNSAGSPVNLLDFAFVPPSETLDRLSLTPPKDLESLLINAGKSAGAWKNSPDSRAGKHPCRRPSLPPFPWSHGGASKANGDAVKLLASRFTCQSKWARLRRFPSSPTTLSLIFKDLHSLTYDELLVPTYNRKRPLEQTASFPNASRPSKAEHCPRAAAAARTLCDMASRGGNKKQKRPCGGGRSRKTKATEKADDGGGKKRKKARLSAIDGKVKTWLAPKCSRARSAGACTGTVVASVLGERKVRKLRE